MEKTFNSVAEFQEYYFSEERLNYLEKELCDNLGLTFQHQHRISKNPNNPNLGFIEVAIPSSLHNSPENIVNSFYHKRGFNINKKNKIIEAKKDNESYWIIVQEGSTSYTINIMKIY